MLYLLKKRQKFLKPIFVVAGTQNHPYGYHGTAYFHGIEHQHLALDELSSASAWVVDDVVSQLENVVSIDNTN